MPSTRRTTAIGGQVETRPDVTRRTTAIGGQVEIKSHVVRRTTALGLQIEIAPRSRLSLQNIRDGIFATLTACGPYAACEISTCSYDVMEMTSACAITYFPGANSRFEQLTMGLGSKDLRIWSIEGDVWVKDTGDPKLLHSRAWQAHDDIYETLKKDRSLCGMSVNAQVTGISYNPEVGFQTNEQFYARVHWNMTAEELD